MSAMQYFRALERLIGEVVLAEPALGTVNALKADLSDSFFHICLCPMDSPKLGIFLTSEVEEGGLLAIPLTLPMGWKNSPSIFCTAKKTVADLANAALHCNKTDLPHRLDYMVGSIVRYAPPTLQPALEGQTRDPYLRRSNSKLAACVDFFVDDFLSLAQGPSHWRR